MRTVLSTSWVIHQVYGTDRQLHRPHLAWQVVTVHSDRSVPGLFTCCWWERSRERKLPRTDWDSHRSFEVCVYACAHSPASSLAARRTARGKLKSVYGFYLLMASRCCVSSVNKCLRFIKLMFFAGQQAGAHLSRSPSFAPALFGAAMSCLDSGSGVTQGPCCVWLPDSCPLLQRQTMKQPYIIGQQWGGDRQSHQNQ